MPCSEEGLWLPRIVHALVDLQLLAMYRPLRDDPDAARLISGTDPQATGRAAAA